MDHSEEYLIAYKVIQDILRKYGYVEYDGEDFMPRQLLLDEADKYKQLYELAKEK